MPQIFDDAGRERVRVLLLENGFELIKAHGLKKTSISDIAKSAGIATGTFYNFFKTKEEFVYQIILHKRARSKELLAKLSNGSKINADIFRQYLYNLYTTDNNIFEYLSESEIAQLKARWPEEYWRNSSNDQATVSQMLNMLEDPRPDCDWKVLGNLFKSITLVGHGKDQLYQDKYYDTIGLLIDTIVKYVFGK